MVDVPVGYGKGSGDECPGVTTISRKRERSTLVRSSKSRWRFHMILWLWGRLVQGEEQMDAVGRSVRGRRDGDGAIYSVGRGKGRLGIGGWVSSMREQVDKLLGLSLKVFLNRNSDRVWNQCFF